MNLIYTFSAIVLAALLFGGGYLLRNNARALTIAKRVAALVLTGVAFYRYMIEHEAVYYIHGLYTDINVIPHPFDANLPLTVFAVILMWFAYASLFAVVMDQFFEYPTLRNITRYFSAPVLLIALGCFNIYSAAIAGIDPYSEFDLRIPFAALEIAIALALIALNVIDGKIKLPTKQQWITLLYTLPFALIPMMPCYVPQALIGFRYTTQLHIYDLTQEHRIVLYFGIIIPFLIFHALKDKSYDVKRFCMIYMSFAMLWTYISYWTLPDFSNPLNWPLHLCNTAMFLIPLCLTLKLNRLFYFCLFINVMGALLAMLMPNTAETVNAIGTERINYWVNHYAAFFMPLLLVSLKIFKRPKFKEWVYALTAFCVYFVLMLVINAWFSNYGDVDYFFLNSDFIVSKLGKWAEDTRLISISPTIGGLTLTFYPLYQFLFFIVYVAITVGIWFLYELLFRMWDAAEDMRIREKEYRRKRLENE